ncbi:Acyl-CoA N-acyltransferase [Apiospora arundinis]
MGTPFISILEPSKFEGYDRTKTFAEQPDKASIPKVFMDAMEVREAVFVGEQNMPLQYEYDDDDPRSCHWVIYASVREVVEEEKRDPQTGETIQPRRSETRTQPIGTMRIVPFPQPPHPKPGGWYEDYKLVDPPPSAAYLSTSSAPKVEVPKPGYISEAAAATGLGVGATSLAAPETLPQYQQDRATTFHNGQEPYVKVGRLAVHPNFRGRKISSQLWMAARDWLKANPRYFDPSVTERGMEALNAHSANEIPRWGGLVYAHVQEAATKVYARWGFQVDEGMGRWHEEGVPHVGMFIRLDV